MRTKLLQGWDSLIPYGIKALTGEADALNFRLLCDVTAQGWDLIRYVLALSPTDKPPLRPEWNGPYEGWDPIGCVMLPYTMFEPLAVMALYNENYPTMLSETTGEVIGFFPVELLKEWNETHPDSTSYDWAAIARQVWPHAKRFYYVANPHACGDRVMHAMSGRVE